MASELSFQRHSYSSNSHLWLIAFPDFLYLAPKIKGVSVSSLTVFTLEPVDNPRGYLSIKLRCKKTQNLGNDKSM